MQEVTPLFYIVFFSQIILISQYIPGRMVRQMQHVLNTCPPATYPRLYSQPLEYYQDALRNYRIKNRIILLGGIVLLALLVVYPRSGEWDRPIVGAYFLLQFYPVILLDLLSIGHLKRMRLARSESTRVAELQPRRLFNFVSPAVVALAAFVYLTFVILILFIRQFEFPWFGGYWNIVAVSIMDIMFIVIIFRTLRGKKRNQYQAHVDRLKEMAATVRAMVFVSIAGTGFIAIIVVLASLELRALEPLLTSLYFQLLAVVFLRVYNVEGMDFEVYRESDTGDRQESDDPGYDPSMSQ